MRSGRRAGRRTLVVHLRCARADDGLLPAHEQPRVGFIVARSVGGAVVRNLVKRRLRAHMSTRLGRLSDGSRLVVRALPPAASARGAELAADLDSALDAALRRCGQAPVRSS